MEASDAAIQQAEQRMRERMESSPRAIAARYDRRVARIMVALSNGLELAFPPHLAEGLADAKPADLAAIEITPSGLGLHWPRLDADLYLPALLQGVFGSPRWMAGLLGRSGGLARTLAKTKQEAEVAAPARAIPPGFFVDRPVELPVERPGRKPYPKPRTKAKQGKRGFKRRDGRS